MGFEKEIFLSKNCCVMLKRNLRTRVVNGVPGYVSDIPFTPGKTPAYHLPLVVLVDFDKHDRPAFANNSVSIPAVDSQSNSEATNCT